MSDIAVLPKTKKQKKDKPKKEPRFHVILWNDDVHTFEYVIVMLHTIFGYPPEKGLQLAKEVHFSEKAVVFTSSLEHAEVKRDRILGFGADPLLAASDGPIIATLERAADD